MNYKTIGLLVILILILGGVYMVVSPSLPSDGTPMASTTSATTTLPVPGTSSGGDTLTPEPAQSVTLGVGQTAQASGLTITFNELVQDSRCAVDVVCIQAGAIVANITLATKYGDTITFNKPSDEVPTWWMGYEVSITETKPEPRSTVRINPKDYIVTFFVAPNALTNGNEPRVQ
jgi:hypothetical protein